MKLSGHSYSNDVFESLINKISPDVVYTKLAEKADPASPVSGLDVFSSTGHEEFKGVQEEELQAITAELQFAADRSKVAVSQEDLVHFAHQSLRDGLRGKSLERAAQKFCNKLHRDVAPPIGDSRNINSPTLLDNANNSAVIPASYNSQHGPNDSKTGGYMGQSMNPNTIWDSGKLAEASQTPSGDEQIKASKDAQEKFAADQKQQYWEAIQTKMGDPEVIQSKAASVANVSTKEGVGNQNMPANSMSVFSDERKFENIPEKTSGENLKNVVEERSTKKEAAKDEWNRVAPAERVNTRSSIDKIFEGLVEGK